MLRICTLLLLSALPISVGAEGASVFGMDLNNDGRVERFSIVPGQDGVDLQVENTGGGVIYFEDIAENATLSGDLEGGLLVTTVLPFEDGSTWEQTLTITAQDGGYIVTRLMFIRRFSGTENPMLVEGWNLVCDLDLTGGESLYIEYDMLVGISTDLQPFSPADWTIESPVPQPCAELLLDL